MVPEKNPPENLRGRYAEAIRDHLEDLDVVCPLWDRDYEAGDVPCDAHQRLIDALVLPLAEAVLGARDEWMIEAKSDLKYLQRRHDRLLDALDEKVDALERLHAEKQRLSERAAADLIATGEEVERLRAALRGIVAALGPDRICACEPGDESCGLREEATDALATAHTALSPDAPAR